MTAVAADPLYRIGEVAETVGVTPRTIRYYEELGLLGATEERVKGSHRLYADSDVARLRELVSMRDLLGLKLEDMTELAEAAQLGDCLRTQWEASTADAERARIVEASIPLVERKLALVAAHRARLDEFEAGLLAKQDRLRTLLAEFSRL